jgi:hypothetical protein
MMCDGPNQGTLTEGEDSARLISLFSLDQLIFIFKIVVIFDAKQATLTRRSTVLSFPLQIVFPGLAL